MWQSQGGSVPPSYNRRDIHRLVRGGLVKIGRWVDSGYTAQIKGVIWHSSAAETTFKRRLGFNLTKKKKKTQTSRRVIFSSRALPRKDYIPPPNLRPNGLKVMGLEGSTLTPSHRPLERQAPKRKGRQRSYVAINQKAQQGIWRLGWTNPHYREVRMRIDISLPLLPRKES